MKNFFNVCFALLLGGSMSILSAQEPTAGPNRQKKAYIQVTLCGGESFQIPGGQKVSTPGMYDGSDGNSYEVTIGELKPEIVENVTICQGESYKWSVNGRTYNTATTVTFRKDDPTSCQPYKLVLKVYTPAVGKETINICPGSAFTYTANVRDENGQYPQVTFTAPGTKSVTVLSQVESTNGGYCDSTIQVTAKELQLKDASEKINVCDYPYTWSKTIGGVTETLQFTANGTKKAVFTGKSKVACADGTYCDSTIQVTAAKIVTKNGTQSINVCEYPYKYSNPLDPTVTYTFLKNETHTITFTEKSKIVGADGYNCDSLIDVTAKLIVTKPAQVTVKVCEYPYTYSNTLDEDITYRFTKDGMQSIIYEGKSKVKGADGNYCDSTIEVTAKELKHGEGTDNVKACTWPYSYTNTLDPSNDDLDNIRRAGTYPITFVGKSKLIDSNGNHCDSVINVVVTKVTVEEGEETKRICVEDFPYTWKTAKDRTIKEVFDGRIAKENRAITIPGASANGCDSTVNVTIEKVVIPETDVEEKKCSNDFPYTWSSKDKTVKLTFLGTKDTETKPATLRSADGCDSVVNVTVIKLPEYDESVSVDVCEDQFPYTWQDTKKTTSLLFNGTRSKETKDANLKTVDGCDSVVHVTVIKLQALEGNEDIRKCEDEFPFTWYSTDRTARYTFRGTKTTETYNAVVESSQGCDSTIHVTVTKIIVPDGEENLRKCPGEFPFTWKSSDKTETIVFQGLKQKETKTVTLQTADGCDSTVTITVEAVQVEEGQVNINRCAADVWPYTWKSKDKTATLTFKGVKDVETQDAVVSTIDGCDSTIHVTVKKITIEDTYDTIRGCSGDFPLYWKPAVGTPLKFYGTLETETKTAYLTSVDGCDSLVYVTAMKKEAIETVEKIYKCESQFPYYWVSGDATEKLIFRGTTSPQTLTAYLTTEAGCDSTVDVVVYKIPDPALDTINKVICVEDTPFTWNGKQYAKSGIYEFDTLSWAGCDSMVWLNLSVVTPVKQTFDITACNGKLPFVWDLNGKKYYKSGNYNETILSNVGNCDSVIATLKLTVAEPTSSEFDSIVCDKDLPIYWGKHIKNVINAQGTYTDTLTNAAGCDSVIVLHVKVAESIEVYDTLYTCYDDMPFTAPDGRVYAQATPGLYKYTYGEARKWSGCDSIINRVLIIGDKTFAKDTIDIFACAGTPYTYNGKSYTPSKDTTIFPFADTILNYAGCDSISTIRLIKRPVYNIKDTVVTCSLPYYWVHAGDTVLTCTWARPYSWKFKTIYGCDSIVNLMVKKADANVGGEAVVICENELPFMWHGMMYDTVGVDAQHIVVPGTTPNIYIGADTATNIAGCDSVITLKLTVNPITYFDTVIKHCDKDYPFTWDGHEYWNGDEGLHSYPTAEKNRFGCDSMIRMTLVSISDVYSRDTLHVCDNEIPYSWNGQTLTGTGDYQAKLPWMGSTCDSTVYLHFEVYPTYAQTYTQTICQGDSVVFEKVTTDKTYRFVHTEAGIYQDTFPTVNGCDSIWTVNLTVQKRAADKDTTVHFCQGSNVEVWGHIFSSLGDTTITDTIRYAAAPYCDSLVFVMNLKVDSLFFLTINDTTCQGDTYTVLDCRTKAPIISFEAKADTMFSDTVRYINTKCDSLIRIYDLKVYPVYNVNADYTICEGDTLHVKDFIHDFTHTAAGTYTDALYSIYGCDSIVNVTLAVQQVLDTRYTDASVCLGDAYVWAINGQTYVPDVDTVDTYAFPYSVAPYCDSIVNILRLHVTMPSSQTINDTICEGELPFTKNIGGNNYVFTKKEGAVEEYHILNMFGCDSTIYYNLTIIPTVFGDTTVYVCENKLPFAWHGDNYAAGDYMGADTLISATGCDSIVNLHVITTYPTTRDTVVYYCQDQMPYLWVEGWGQTINVGGVHTAYALIPAADYESACADTIWLNLMVGESHNTWEPEISVCGEDALPYIWYGQQLTTTGDYMYDSVNIYGCVDTINVHFNAYPAYNIVTDTAVCDAQWCEWRGKKYYVTGTYSDPFTSVHGCDSTYVLNLVMAQSVNVDTTLVICYPDLPYVLNDGTEIWSSGDYTDRGTTMYGCDSVTGFTLIVDTANNHTGHCVYDTLCRDSFPYLYNGHRNWVSGIVPAVGRYVQGDVVYHIAQSEPLDIQMLDTLLEICGDATQQAFQFALTSNSELQSFNVSYNSYAKGYGLKDTMYIYVENSDMAIMLPIPSTAWAGDYEATVTFNDRYCPSCSKQIKYHLAYGSDVIAQRWHDLLAVTKETSDFYGGFTAYQWYKNGVPQNGQTGSQYYVSGKTLERGAKYSVELTRKADGLKIRSCDYEPDFTEPSQLVMDNVPSVTITNNNTSLRVRSTRSAQMNMYSVTGALMLSMPIREGETVIDMPVLPGVYMMYFSFSDSETETYKFVKK